MNPGQQTQLESWVDKRDKILREIGIYQTERDSLFNYNKEAGLSLASLHKSISESKGRIAEILETEERLKNSTTNEISALIAQKSRLESEIETKKVEVKSLEEKKLLLIETINSSIAIHEKTIDRVSGIDEKVESLSKVTGNSKFVIEELIESVKKGCQELNDLNEKNVKATNLVLDKLPAMLIELQKNKLIRPRLK